MKFNYNIVYHNDTAYLVQRKIKESLNPILAVWKEHLRSDIILKKGDVFYFCEEIIELQEIQDD